MGVTAAWEGEVASGAGTVLLRADTVLEDGPQ